MGRTALSNNLLGRYITPRGHAEHIFDNWNMDHRAEIVAAWVDNEGHLKIQATDSQGRNGGFYLEHVKVFRTVQEANTALDLLADLRTRRDVTYSRLMDAADDNSEAGQQLQDDLRQLLNDIDQDISNF